MIDKKIAELPDWQGVMIARLRKIIHDEDPKIVEEWKWNTAVFSDEGMVCALGAFKDHVKVNFFKGASLKDQHKLFNSGFEAKASRSIDLHEKDKLVEASFKDLVREAANLNKKQ